VADRDSNLVAESVSLRHDASRRNLPTRFRSPLAALAASFALGIVWAHFLRTTVGIHWVLIGALAYILAGLILLRAGWDRAAICFALASLFFTGVAAARRWEQRFPLNHIRYLGSMGADLHDVVRLRGRVVSTPYRSGYGVQFDVEAQQVESLGHAHKVIGRIRLRVEGSGELHNSENISPYDVRYNDVIQASVRLRRPRIYQNPGSFDFRRWLEDIEDIYWVGTIKNPGLMVRIGHVPGFHFTELAERARQRLLRGIDDLYPPWSVQGRYGAVLKAVLWGDRTALDSATVEDFRQTGLYHLLVIAGLHVGLLTLLLEFLLRRVGCRRVSRALIVLGFLGIYALLVEQRAATLRATLMIALYLVARIIDREHSPLNSIGAVALVLLYVRPPWLFESGFQLSFAAALLIVGIAVPVLQRTTGPYLRALRRLDDVLLDDHFSPRLAQARLDLRALVSALRRRAAFFDRFPILSRNLVVAPLRLLVWTANILIFSAVLQLGLLLPMVETFHRVTFAGVGLNALAIPVMTLLLALALPINLASVMAPAVAVWPAKVLSLVMAVLFGMTHLPGLAPWLSYRMPSPPHWVTWGFCGAFIFAAWTLRRSPRTFDFDRALGPADASRAAGGTMSPAVHGAALVACAVFVALVALHPVAPRLPHGALQMTVLDCGQGDALFLVFPDATTMLVDAGGSRTHGTGEGGFQGRRWDPGEDIVSPFLWSLGIQKLDIVAVSDAQENHFGGLGAILDNFRVGELWHSPHPETPEYATLLERAAARGIPTRTLMTGDELSFGRASIQVLGPKSDSPAATSVSDRRRPSDMDPTDRGGSSASFANDDSVAMRISASGTSFLLSGDVGWEAEKGMLDSGEPLESQVLKVSYHRSKPPVTGDFLARVAPRVAIISAESDGGGGSPHPEMLRALRHAGIRVFETGIDGAVTVEAKPGSFAVSTYAGAKKN